MIESSGNLQRSAHFFDFSKFMTGNIFNFYIKYIKKYAPIKVNFFYLIKNIYII